MSSNKKKVQIALLLFGFILIFSTYFFYPKITQKESLQVNTEIKKPLKIEKEQSNVFESVSYEGFYNVINPFTLKSENAYILDEDSNIVYMKKMHPRLILPY